MAFWTVVPGRKPDLGCTGPRVTWERNYVTARYTYERPRKTIRRQEARGNPGLFLWDRPTRREKESDRRWSRNRTAPMNSHGVGPWSNFSRLYE